MPQLKRLMPTLACACAVLGKATLAWAAATPAVVPPAASGLHPAQFMTDQPAPDPAERGYIAARLYQAVTTYFAHEEALPESFNFEAAYRAFLVEAFAARTRLDFDKAAMRMLSALHNGHTGFTDQLASAAPPLPFTALQLDGRWIVTTSRLAKGEIDPGDEIVTLNGQPIQAWINANIVFVQRSNQAESEMSLFSAAFLWPARLQLGLGDRRTITIDRSRPEPGAWRGLIVPDSVVVSEPAPGIIRIQIPGFDKPQYEEAALEAVRHHRDARVILFDVRGNGGGSTPQRLLNALIERPYYDMIDSTPLHIGTLDAWAEGGEVVLPKAMVRAGGEIIQPDHPIFHGQVLVLADRGCASACEDLVLGLHESGRARIVGETTYGSTGQPYLVGFPEVRMSLRVGARREYRHGLKPFEGVGVIPDSPVALTQDALRSGDDPVLQRALAIARQD